MRPVRCPAPHFPRIFPLGGGGLRSLIFHSHGSDRTACGYPLCGVAGQVLDVKNLRLAAHDQVKKAIKKPTVCGGPSFFCARDGSRMAKTA